MPADHGPISGLFLDLFVSNSTKVHTYFILYLGFFGTASLFSLFILCKHAHLLFHVTIRIRLWSAIEVLLGF